VHPQHADEHARLETIAKAVKAREVDAERVQAQIGGLSDKMSRLAQDKDVRGLHRDIAELRAASTRQHRMLSQALRLPTGRKRCAWTSAASGVASRGSPKARGRSWSVPGRARSDSSCSTGSPSSPGRCAKPTVNPDRLVIVSRGGPASWYAHLGGRYVDVLESVTPENSAGRTEAQKKQHGVGAFDREILRRVIEAEKLERPALLHPGLMYRAFRPFWHQEATVHRVDDYARYERLQVAPNPALAGGSRATTSPCGSTSAHRSRTRPRIAPSPSHWCAASPRRRMW
jgi:hypothetical protein